MNSFLKFKRFQKDVRCHLSKIRFCWKLKSDLIIFYLFAPQRQLSERGALPFTTVFPCELIVVVDAKVLTFMHLGDFVRNFVDFRPKKRQAGSVLIKFIHYLVIEFIKIAYYVPK